VRWKLDRIRETASASPEVLATFSLPSLVAMVLSLLRYYASLLVFLQARGLSVHPAREDYLLAKEAGWSVSRQRGDDFLVDGQSIVSSDLLILYNSTSVKPDPGEAVEAAKAAGYRTVAIDRTKVPLGWLWSPRTIIRFVIGPAVLTLRLMIPGVGTHAPGLVWLMLHLRRQVLTWDVFFETYRVRCLIVDSIGTEGQAATTMAIHSHGGVAAAIQATENSDEFNELVYYVTCHYLFTWGEGVDGPWKDTWCVNEVVPAGYIWGHLHEKTLEDRESVRRRFGVGPDQSLVGVFDSGVASTSFNTPETLSRFYRSVVALAAGVDNAVVVIKPKNKGTPVAHLMPDESASIPQLDLRDPVYINTNELISAADLVVSMAHSSTLVEALICQVPSVALDETGRDWSRVVGRPDVLIFDHADELRKNAYRILDQGLDPSAWMEVQWRVRQNFGVADRRAIDRIRASILEACGVSPGTDRTPNRNVLEDVATRPVSAD